MEGWIGQDTGSGPERSITLLAAVGWFGGPIFLIPLGSPDEMVRDTGHVEFSPPGTGRSVFCACVCRYETQQTRKSSLWGAPRKRPGGI